MHYTTNNVEATLIEPPYVQLQMYPSWLVALTRSQLHGFKI